MHAEHMSSLPSPSSLSLVVAGIPQEKLLRMVLSNCAVDAVHAQSSSGNSRVLQSKQRNRKQPSPPGVTDCGNGRLQRLASCGLAAAFVKHECSERPYKGSNAFL